MFVIGTTQKLEKEINRPLADPEEYTDVPDIYQWHANLITINRRKCLILMNNETGLNLTLFGLRKQQFENIDNVVRGSLKQLFQMLEIEDTIVDQMLKASEEVVYTKTNSRQVLGLMKEIKFTVEDRTQGLDYDDIDAVEINSFNNVKMVSQAHKHITPYDTFVKYFEEE